MVFSETLDGPVIRRDGQSRSKLDGLFDRPDRGISYHEYIPGYDAVITRRNLA